jgi:hypothetical protein
VQSTRTSVRMSCAQAREGYRSRSGFDTSGTEVGNRLRSYGWFRAHVTCHGEVSARRKYATSDPTQMSAPAGRVASARGIVHPSSEAVA